MTGAYSLSDVRAEKIELICDRCGRQGTFTVAKLIAKYGNASIPALRSKLTEEANCPHAGNRYDPCKAKFSRESVLSWSRPEDAEYISRLPE